MTYSMALYPNDQTAFPPPPPWLVWGEERRWNYSKRTYEEATGEGQVRHHDTLAVAKKNVGRADSEGKFYVDWAIYEWDRVALRYELRYEGKRGDARKDHPLFKRGAVRKDKPFREVSDDD